MLVFQRPPRRFGHAATDRQDAYLSSTEIEGRRARDPLAGFIGDAVERGVLDANTVAARNDEIARAREMRSTRPRPSRSSTTARHWSNASPRRSRPCRRRRPQQPERKTSSGSTRRAF